MSLASASGEAKMAEAGKARQSTAATVLFVPGLRDDMPDHWQSILEKQLPRTACVPRIQHNKLDCNVWVEKLEQTLSQIDGPVILVAHSGGVMITVHWAQRYRRAIRGALLAAPPDFETPLPEGYPTMDTLQANGWLPTPRRPLPFRSIVAASTNDPLGRFERVAGLAAAWGSKLVDVGAVGHLNPAAGYGPWPRAADFVRELDELL